MIRKEREKVMYRHPLYPFMLADVDYLHQMELTMAEDRTFDTVCVNPEDLKQNKCLEIFCVRYTAPLICAIISM